MKRALKYKCFSLKGQNEQRSKSDQLAILGTEPRHVKDLVSLTMIYLNGNQISTLPLGVFTGLSSLDVMFLDGNQISTLSPGIFAGLGSVTCLYLHSNQISMLPPGVFKGLSSLSTLHLQNNQLTTLEWNVFDLNDFIQHGGHQGKYFYCVLDIKIHMYICTLVSLAIEPAMNPIV